MERIYIVRAGESGPLKIGKSANVSRRISRLQTACPERLHLLFMADNIDGLEERMHKGLSESWIGGEWFRCSPDFAIESAKLLGAVPLSLPSDRSVCTMQRIGPGRPKLAKEHKRRFSSWLPLSANERAILQAAADRHGEVLAVWARGVLLREASK